ncbi:MAG TPA: CHAT domain-containing tetratricopeptide repeat protein [Edaphobacter sp.]|uniref:CHAT domain-containing protein n=1 Tax=Edaphobacter sp. TaxID=1934404 RepID=UPI002C505F45|nr:CHAT domain-containing tetratricopeptide repeat protein [Edaphobacter sp.]HUZ95706.1 CHAT domain-containing tetratricopeptide repeat protein [Edaphobacter sp.]
MRIAVPPRFRIVAGLLLAALLSVVVYQVVRRRDSQSPEALLKHADDLSWLNAWIQAEPYYRRAEVAFRAKGESSKALYAQVSEMPAKSESSTTIPNQIAVLRQDLLLPAARDPETRLRILTILGMLETNYDAGMARTTWTEVESLARARHHYLLASRAVGEQGIAAFLLGDIKTAKKDVLRAWMVAKFTDPAARIRYASMYGTGLVELHKYKEALGPLNEAIKTAANTPHVAYPTIAITAKISALSGLGRYQEALQLANEEMRKVSAYHLTAHLYDLYRARALVYQQMNAWNQAIGDYQEAIKYAEQLSYWRGISESDGLLAKAYLHQGMLNQALSAIDEAIDANKQIPDEMYFVPRNLAIKAEILARLGKVQASDDLYEKSADLLDALLSRVPTPMVERQLLDDLSVVYAGYFASLSSQGKLGDAFRVIERARGRIEAQALSHHAVIPPHAPSAAELRLTRLDVRLLDTDNPAARGQILNAIYTTEQQLGDDDSDIDTPPDPVALSQLEQDLHPSELFVEYVLAEPHSYALAVTREGARCYTLAPKSELTEEASQYRAELMDRKADLPLAQKLFHSLLGGIPEYRAKADVIVVPDGELELLPFNALAEGGQYVLATHTVSVAPSGTVLDLLRHRANLPTHTDLAFLGVAAWISKAPPVTLLAMVRRAVSGLNRSELVALPESRYEVETVATDLPQPHTILLGGNATETDFKRLPLDQYEVIHLALHGYADPEFPDRSALVFAPENPPIDDGLLQVREIRQLHLNASLVTLSACDTGVGPVGEEGVADIVNAFIEAGAKSVVSTLWAIDDQATAKLMIDFYGQLGRGASKAGALRQAQIEMMKSGEPPYYWAGFELDGEPSDSLLGQTADHLLHRSSR